MIKIETFLLEFVFYLSGITSIRCIDSISVFQAAHCFLHMAALVAEYLRRRGKLLIFHLEKFIFTKNSYETHCMICCQVKSSDIEDVVVSW